MLYTFLYKVNIRDVNQILNMRVLYGQVQNSENEENGQEPLKSKSATLWWPHQKHMIVNSTTSWPSNHPWGEMIHDPSEQFTKIMNDFTGYVGDLMSLLTRHIVLIRACISICYTLTLARDVCAFLSCLPFVRRKLCFPDYHYMSTSKHLVNRQ